MTPGQQGIQIRQYCVDKGVGYIYRHTGPLPSKICLHISTTLLSSAGRAQDCNWSNKSRSIVILRPAVRSREGRRFFCTIQLYNSSVFDCGGWNPSFADFKKFWWFWDSVRTNAIHRSANTPCDTESLTLSAEKCWYCAEPFLVNLAWF